MSHDHDELSLDDLEAVTGGTGPKVKGVLPKTASLPGSPIPQPKPSPTSPLPKTAPKPGSAKHK